MPVHAFHTHFTPHRSPCEASARSWVLSCAQTLPGATSSLEAPSDSSPSSNPSLTQTPPGPHMDQEEGPESEPRGEGAGPGAPGDGLHRDEGSHQVGQFAQCPGALSGFPVVWPSTLSGTLHWAPCWPRAPPWVPGMPLPSGTAWSWDHGGRMWVGHEWSVSTGQTHSAAQRDGDFPFYTFLLVHIVEITNVYGEQTHEHPAPSPNISPYQYDFPPSVIFLLALILPHHWMTLEHFLTSTLPQDTL